MAVACWGSRNIVRARVALLDSTGAPDNGASNGWTTDGLVSIAASVQLHTGDEFELLNGDGASCQYYKAPDYVKRVDPVVSLCHADPRLLGLMLGGDVWTDGDGAVGHQIPMQADTAVNVSLEWWTIAQDGANQASIAGVGQYWHHVIPFVHFTMGDVTSELGIETRVLNGQGVENLNITGNGPFDDWPAVIATTDGVTAAYGRFRQATLPAAGCAYVNVTSAAS